MEFENNVSKVYMQYISEACLCQLSALGRGEAVSCAQGAWRASLMDEVGE